MFRRLRDVLSRREREPDPLVKVAGMPNRRDALACLDALEAKGINSEVKEDTRNLGAFELWVRASREPQARLVMGLSGRSVIRLERKRSGGEERTDRKD